MTTQRSNYFITIRRFLSVGLFLWISASQLLFAQQIPAPVNLQWLLGNAIVTATTGVIMVGLSDGSGNAISSSSGSLDVNVTNSTIAVTSSSASTFKASLPDLEAGLGAGTAPSDMIVAGLIYNSGGVSPTNGQTVALQGDSHGYLEINCETGCSGGSGGTSLVDESAFTEGTTSFTPIGGYYKSSPTALTSGEAGTVLLTADRALETAIFDTSGNAVNVTSHALNSYITNSTLTVVQPTAADLLVTDYLNDGSGNAINSTSNALDVYLSGSGLSNLSTNVAEIGGHAVVTAGVNGTLAVGGNQASGSAISSNTYGLLMGGDDYGGTPDFRLWKVDSNGYGYVSIPQLPAAASLGDSTSNPSTTLIGSDMEGWNSSTWDRIYTTTSFSGSTHNGALPNYTNSSTGLLTATMLGYDNTSGSQAYRVPLVTSGNILESYIENSSIAVTGTFYQATQPISITCANDPICSADEATFTYGTSDNIVNGGVYNSSISTLSSGQSGAMALTAYRALHITPYTSGGTEEGTSGTPIYVQFASAQAVTATNATAANFKADVFLTDLEVTCCAPASAPSDFTILGMVYNSSPPGPSNGQVLPLQSDSAGNAQVNLNAGAGTASGSPIYTTQNAPTGGGTFQATASSSSTALASHACLGALLFASSGNTVTVYVANGSGSASATTMPLAAGASIWIPCTNTNTISIYAATTSPTVEVMYVTK